VDDIRDVERRTHRVRIIAECRAPAGGAWIPLLVDSSTGGVTLAGLDELPSRTCSVTVHLSQGGGVSVLEVLSTMGSWVRLAHEITRADGTTFRVPLGYFRVNTLTVDPLLGVVTIAGADVGDLVVDYGLVTLAQGEVLPLGDLVLKLRTMLEAALAGVPPWWTLTLDIAGTPGQLAQARIQRENSRAEAAVYLAGLLNRNLTMPTDGSAAFRLHASKPSNGVPDAVLTGGDLGNLVTLSTEVGRKAVHNVATVSYTPPGGTQARVVREYVTDPLVAAGGPFGRSSVEGDGTNVTSEAEAIARADAKLAATIKGARAVRIACSPVYGVEAGDLVQVVGRNGESLVGYVIGGSIPLNIRNGWSLDLSALSIGPDVEGRRRG
jgi:hypothetical protein